MRPGDDEDDWSDGDETAQLGERAAEARATAAARAAARTRARSAEGNGNGSATSADDETTSRARARRGYGYGKVRSKVNAASRVRTKHAWDDDELPAAFRALPTPPTPPYLRARPATVDERARGDDDAVGDERAATSASSRWELRRRPPCPSARGRRRIADANPRVERRRGVGEWTETDARARVRTQAEKNRGENVRG